jgi:hypothetical protein
MAKRTGKERKAKRRTRRQLNHTYEYESKGIDPAEAKLLAKDARTNPEPLDGDIGTGPPAYVQQDIDRVSKLMQCGVFSKKQKDSMLLLIGSLVANSSLPANVRISAYGKIQREIELYAQLSGELSKDESKTSSEYHLHLHGSGDLSPAEQMLADMRALRDAGSEFRDDVNTIESTPNTSKLDEIDEK